MQTDPARGASPWARGVVEGQQVLICPRCQSENAEWAAALASCPHCGSTRLSIVMGSVVCRSCNSDWPAR